jgi:hypothetical protein
MGGINGDWSISKAGGVIVVVVVVMLEFVGGSNASGGVVPVITLKQAAYTTKE